MLTHTTLTNKGKPYVFWHFAKGEPSEFTIKGKTYEVRGMEIHNKWKWEDDEVSFREKLPDGTYGILHTQTMEYIVSRVKKEI